VIDYFNQRARELNPGQTVPWCSGADNKRATTGADLGGLDLVRHYLEQEKLLFYDKRLHHGPHPELVARGAPTSFTTEVEDYVWWRPKDAEDDMSEARDHTDPACRDDACDCARYLTRLMHDYDFGPPREPVKPVFDDEAMAMRRAMGIG